MSAGPAAGPGASGASGAPATESGSALRPAAALPCPAGPSSWRHLHGTSRTRTGGCGRDTHAAREGLRGRHRPAPARARGPAGGRGTQSAQPRCPPRRRQRRAARPAAPESGASPSGAERAAARGPYLSSPPSASLSSAVRLGDASSLSPLAFPAAIFFSSSPKAAAAAAAVASDTPQDFMETRRIHNSQRRHPPGPGPATTPPIPARDRHTNFIAASSSAAGGGDEKSQRGGGEGGGGRGCGAPGSAAAAARLEGHIAGADEGQPRARTAGAAGAHGAGGTGGIWWRHKLPRHQHKVVVIVSHSEPHAAVVTPPLLARPGPPIAGTRSPHVTFVDSRQLRLHATC